MTWRPAVSLEVMVVIGFTAKYKREAPRESVLERNTLLVTIANSVLKKIREKKDAHLHTHTHTHIT